jgi:hypothetical protein
VQSNQTVVVAGDLKVVVVVVDSPFQPWLCSAAQLQASLSNLLSIRRALVWRRQGQPVPLLPMVRLLLVLVLVLVSVSVLLLLLLLVVQACHLRPHSIGPFVRQ